MEIVWESENREVSVRDVAGELPDHAYTTVATVLDRLVNKQMLTRRMDGRSIRFAVVGSKGAHTAVLMHKALGGGQRPRCRIVLFVEGLSDSEASSLRRALNRLERKARV